MSDPQISRPKVIVTGSAKGRLTQDIIIGSHLLTSDEPVAFGGNDAGPSPYDFILAGLGACTAMTLRYYADLKKIPLKNVTVKLSTHKIYADDCSNCEKSNAKIDQITRLIQLEGDLTDEDRNKLLDIANKCPVHRTLTGKIIIDTQLI